MKFPSIRYGTKYCADESFCDLDLSSLGVYVCAQPCGNELEISHNPRPYFRECGHFYYSIMDTSKKKPMTATEKAETKHVF